MENWKINTVRITFFTFLMLSIFLFSKNQLLIQTQSQFEFIPGNIGIASLFPYQGFENLTLLSADVTMRTELKDFNDISMPINFTCDYIIYNPSTTVNASFVLPIFHDLSILADIVTDFTAFRAWVNGTPAPLQIIDDEFTENIEEELEYFFNFLCLNYTEFQNDTIIHVRISAEVTFSTSLGRNVQILTISNDLRTMNYWNNYFNKTVEFRVNGIQPTSYSDYSDTTPERKCLVTHYESGTSYFWFWEQEQIIENIVMIQWQIPRDKPFTFLVSWDFFSLLLFAISSALVLLVNRRRNKIKRCLHE
ncbi:MAG: hypothetical protein HGN29_16705 [Asgard group archaeon]|nr:hypothetical protein [Asgard group archaeon]